MRISPISLLKKKNHGPNHILPKRGKKQEKDIKNFIKLTYQSPKIHYKNLSLNSQCLRELSSHALSKTLERNPIITKISKEKKYPCFQNKTYVVDSNILRRNDN